MSMCNIFHKHAGCRCERPKGHDGLCSTKSRPDHKHGTITRCEWQSENGKFLRHVAYVTKYPANAQRKSST